MLIYWIRSLTPLDLLQTDVVFISELLAFDSESCMSTDSVTWGLCDARPFFPAP